jgi:hypothetical protein
MASKSTLMQKKKEDLVNIIITMKKELLANRELIEQRAAEADDLDRDALGITKDSSGFNLVSLKYNETNRNAKVENITKLGKDYSIALYKAKKFLVEDILSGL